MLETLILGNCGLDGYAGTLIDLQLLNLLSFCETLGLSRYLFLLGRGVLFDELDGLSRCFFTWLLWWWRLGWLLMTLSWLLSFLRKFDLNLYGDAFLRNFCRLFDHIYVFNDLFDDLLDDHLFLHWYRLFSLNLVDVTEHLVKIINI